MVGLQASRRCPVEQLAKRRARQRHHAQVGQDLLLRTRDEERRW
jgi:hypothetical protein